MNFFYLILLQLGLIFNFNSQINFNNLYITNYQLEQTLLETSQDKIEERIEEQEVKNINDKPKNNLKIENDLKDENSNKKKEQVIVKQNNEKSTPKNPYKNLTFSSSYDDLFLEEKLGIYNYCPSILINDNINIFYCSNRKSKTIKDYICYRKVNNENNGYYYT